MTADAAATRRRARAARDGGRVGTRPSRWRTRAAARALTLALVALRAAPSADAAPLPIGPGEGVRVAPASAYGTTHDAAVAVDVPASFSAAVTVPAGARLIAAVAVPPVAAAAAGTTGTPAAGAAPVRFRVAFEGADATLTLYERVVDVGTRPADRRWFDFGRDLGALAGRHGTLRFEATSAGADAPAAGTGAAGTHALWAAPLLESCDGAVPGILVVVLDALRADHLSGAGYPRPTSPHLDRFADSATRFDAAFSGAPKTIPSVPQLLTGTYFFRQRATAGLSALLGPAGLATSRAVVNNPWVATWLAQERPGFATVVAGELDAPAITSEALRFLSAIGPCRSALYLHYLDTHTPYRPPPRDARRFITPHAATKVGLTFSDVTAAWQGRLAPADRRRVADLYDAAIAATDRQLGRLFRGLARRGLTDRTLVVVTADHGEELWDHGGFFHGQSLYDELLHVPLVLRLPASGHGRRVAEVVSTVDVVPTLAAAAGLPPPPSDGVSLVALASGDADDAARARTVFATVSHAEPRTPPRHAVRNAGMKVIRNVEDGSLEVYDLVQDRHERRNLGPAAPGAEPLVAALDARRAPLAARGDHLRLRSTGDRPVAYVVTLATDPPAPIIEPDRLTLERGDRLRVREHSSAVTLAGTLEPGDEDEIRMDVLATSGALRVTITLDGASAPAGTLRLGADGTIASERVDLADPALLGAPSARAGAPSTPGSVRATQATGAPAVTVALWRTVAPGAGGAPALDPATRARLRELGYVE